MSLCSSYCYKLNNPEKQSHNTMPTHIDSVDYNCIQKKTKQNRKLDLDWIQIKNPKPPIFK